MIPESEIDDLFEIFSTELNMVFYKANTTDERPEGAENPDGVYSTYNLINEAIENKRNVTKSFQKVDDNNTLVIKKTNSRPVISINFLSEDSTKMNENTRKKANELLNLINDAQDKDVDFNGLSLDVLSPTIENRDIFLGGSGGGNWEYKIGFDIVINYCEASSYQVESINQTILTDDGSFRDGEIQLPDGSFQIPEDEAPQSLAVFHSLMEDDTSLLTPAIGFPTIIFGAPNYAPGRFNNGLEGTSGAGVNFDPTDYWANNQMGAIGFWFKPGADFFDNTGFLFFLGGNNNGDPEFQIFATDGDSFVASYHIHGGASYFTQSVTSSDYFSAGVNAFIGYTWNRDGIGGGLNTFEVKINNILVMSGTAIYPLETLPSETFSSIGYVSTLDLFARGVLDNMKFYNTDKNDWSDMDSENA